MPNVAYLVPALTVKVKSPECWLWIQSTHCLQAMDPGPKANLCSCLWTGLTLVILIMMQTRMDWPSHLPLSLWTYLRPQASTSFGSQSPWLSWMASSCPLPYLLSPPRAWPRFVQLQLQAPPDQWTLDTHLLEGSEKWLNGLFIGFACRKHLIPSPSGRLCPSKILID